MARTNPLVPLVRYHVEKDPEDAARMLEALPDGVAAHAVGELPPAILANVFPHFQSGYAATLLANASPEVFEAVTARLEPTHAARIFTRLPADARERFVPHIPERMRDQVREFLTYPEGSVGQVMSARFLTLSQSMTVREAITKLKRLAKSAVTQSYAYVVDADDRLTGVLSTYDLLIAARTDKLDELMHGDLFTLDPFMDARVAAEELGKRRYFAAPVIDSQRHLVGVVKAEQLIAGLEDDVSQDIQKMFGVGAEERAFSPLGYSLRKRLPWLHVNLATAFLAAGVVALFEGIVAKVTALAIFLPVVAGQGGNAGAQSLAIVMRGIVMREIPREHVRKLILKETLLGTINGAVTGLVTALVAWVWMGNPTLGLVIGLGMVINLACAGLAGASIPILMKRFGLDPAQSSSIMLTTVTDVVGFFAFLGLAVVFERQLV